MDRRRPTRFLLCGLCIGFFVCFVIMSNLDGNTQVMKMVRKNVAPADLDLPVIATDTKGSINEPIFFNLSLIDCPREDSVSDEANWRAAEELQCRKRIPQVVGLGTKKGGSAALSFFLNAHPALVHTNPYEVHYWDWHIEEDSEWYRLKMPTSSQFQFTMENTPDYFVLDEAPQGIRALNKRMKFIVIIRDPVLRAVSDFVHELVRKEDFTELHPWVPGWRPRYFLNSTFDTSVLGTDGRVHDSNALVATGMYDFFFERWFRVFPADQFLVIDGELFQKNPLPFLQQVERFLGLPKYFDKDSLYFDDEKNFFCRQKPRRQCLPDTKGREHPPISDEVVEALRSFYKPHNKRLEELLGQTFSWTDL